MFLWYPVLDLARAFGCGRTARKMSSGYENGLPRGCNLPINVNPVGGGRSGLGRGFDKKYEKTNQMPAGGRKVRSNKGNFTHPRVKSYIF
jgi:hypothetical protein